MRLAGGPGGGGAGQSVQDRSEHRSRAPTLDETRAYVANELEDAVPVLNLR